MPTPLSIFTTAISHGQLSCRQMAILCAASEETGSVKDYAAKLGIVKPAVTRGIDALVEAGLVDRMPDPRDGRQVRVTVTSKGAALVAQLSNIGEA